jgi:hypothetical protein
VPSAAGGRGSKAPLGGVGALADHPGARLAARARGAAVGGGGGTSGAGGGVGGTSGAAVGGRGATGNDPPGFNGPAATLPVGGIVPPDPAGPDPPVSGAAAGGAGCRGGTGGADVEPGGGGVRFQELGIVRGEGGVACGDANPPPVSGTGPPGCGLTGRLVPPSGGGPPAPERPGAATRSRPQLGQSTRVSSAAIGAWQWEQVFMSRPFGVTGPGVRASVSAQPAPPYATPILAYGAC